MQVSELPAFLESLPPAERQALLAAAVPSWFDEATLNALLPDLASAQHSLVVLCSCLPLTPHADLPGWYALDERQQQELLALLQNRFPELYRLYHRRAVAHFAALLAPSQVSPRASYEGLLMSLLERLFRRYMSIHEVPELASVLDAATIARFEQDRHRFLFDYYRGCADNERGAYDSAGAIFARLLAEPQLPDVLRARTCTALGINLNYREQYDRAIDAHQQSRAAYVRLNDRLGQAKSLSNAGIIYSQLGRYEEAIAVLQESYALAVEDGDPVQRGRVLNELGLASKELGRWDAALEYYRGALAIWQEEGNRVSQGRVDNNLGEVFFLNGRWEEARLHFERALAIALHSEVQDRRQAADMLHNLGLLCFSQRQYEEARAHYEESLRLSREIESPAAISLIYQRLGQLWESQEHPRKAYEAYRQAIEVLETMRGRVERQETKISLLGTRQQPYEFIVLLCWRLGWYARAFHFAERARARAFLDLLAQRRPRANGTVGEAAQDPKAVAGGAEPPLTLRQVCRNLPKDAALMAYFTTGLIDWGEGVIQNLPEAAKNLRNCLAPSGRTLAFVLTRAGLVAQRDLAIDPNVLRPGPTDDPARDSRFLDDRKLRQMYDLLVAPLWDYVRNQRVLHVAPHGPLHYLPFAALSGADNRRLLHADHPRLAYAPSATVLVRHCCGAPSTAPRSCLALGYNGRGPTALRQAEVEAQSVAGLWDGDGLTGDGPKKIVLQETGSQYRLLHFACHGQFNPRDPLGSFLILGAEERLTAAEIIEQMRLEADLVSLSACQSGVSHIARGDELMGLIRAFLSAGASSLVVTQWRVADVSTRIVMERFHRNLQGGMSNAEALWDAQLSLQELTWKDLREILRLYGQGEAEIQKQVEELLTTMGIPVDSRTDGDLRVFAHPRFWAPFILVGHA